MKCEREVDLDKDAQVAGLHRWAGEEAVTEESTLGKQGWVPGRNEGKGALGARNLEFVVEREVD